MYSTTGNTYVLKATESNIVTLLGKKERARIANIFV